MMMVRVKICGITRLEDAVAALTAGADYLGFILYPPSPRFVTPDFVVALTGQLRYQPATGHLFTQPNPPLLVGVFVNEPDEQAAELLDYCGLDLAQLSGDEEAVQLTNAGSPLYGRGYKAIRPRTVPDAHEKAAAYDALPSDDDRPRLLLDTPHAALYGGTGEIGDWSIAAEIAATMPGVMLAGGLTPANVAEAVRWARPFAVDVAGGVEAAPGRKDHDLVRAFIANAKQG